MESPFAKSFHAKLDAFTPGLAADLGSILALEESTAQRVLRFLMESACLSQGMNAIQMGRKKMLALPRRWVLEHIECVATELVNFEDDYEVRRLLELSALLDEDLTSRILERVLQSPVPDVKEAAEDFKAAFERRPRLERLSFPLTISPAKAVLLPARDEHELELVG